jgi:hypothetical protein
MPKGQLFFLKRLQQLLALYVQFGCSVYPYTSYLHCILHMLSGHEICITHAIYTFTCYLHIYIFILHAIYTVHAIYTEHYIHAIYIFTCDIYPYLHVLLLRTAKS